MLRREMSYREHRRSGLSRGLARNALALGLLTLIAVAPMRAVAAAPRAQASSRCSGSITVWLAGNYQTASQIRTHTVSCAEGRSVGAAARAYLGVVNPASNRFRRFRLLFEALALESLRPSAGRLREEPIDVRRQGPRERVNVVAIERPYVVAHVPANRVSLPVHVVEGLLTDRVRLLLRVPLAEKEPADESLVEGVLRHTRGAEDLGDQVSGHDGVRELLGPLPPGDHEVGREADPDPVAQVALADRLARAGRKPRDSRSAGPPHRAGSEPVLRAARRRPSRLAASRVCSSQQRLSRPP
jgi:hypothetical protein